MRLYGTSIVLSSLYLTALVTSCATQQTGTISQETEQAVKKVVCKMVCEVSFSATQDTQRTIAEIRVLNAVTRSKCGALLQPCHTRVKVLGP